MSRSFFQNACLAIITIILLGWTAVWAASSYYAHVAAERIRKEQTEKNWKDLQKKWDAELADMEWENIERKAKNEVMRKALERTGLQD